MRMRDYQCWPDPDGKHVWFRHACKSGQQTTMLPTGPWRLIENRRVEPSISCEDCGFHMMLFVTHDADPESGAHSRKEIDNG